MTSTELSSIQAQRELAVGSEAGDQPPAERSRGRAVFRAIAVWLWRALADSSGAWALAAGAPPDLHRERGRLPVTALWISPLLIAPQSVGVAIPAG